MPEPAEPAEPGSSKPASQRACSTPQLRFVGASTSLGFFDQTPCMKWRSDFVCCQGLASLREPSPPRRSHRRHDDPNCPNFVSCEGAVDAWQDQSRLKKETAERLRQPFHGVVLPLQGRATATAQKKR